VVVEVLGHHHWHLKELSLPTTINRVNIVLILLVTEWLIKSSLEHLENIYLQKQQIAHYQAELSTRLRLDRMQQDFVHTLTHDLKTPLIGSTQISKYFAAKKFGSVSSTQADVLAKMSRSQQKSLKLVETLLDVYRNDAEGLVLQHQPIDLCAIAQEAIDSVVVLGLERQITLNFQCNNLEVQHPELFSDPLQLSRVFINLLSNAIDHSPYSGRIDIKIDYLDFNYLI
jgi:two-component system, NarL family, sensor kinase